MDEHGARQIRSYQDLDVWKVGVDLVAIVYKVSSRLPADERFGLISQVRRSSVSVPANFAEGYGRNSNKDFVRFLRMAQGSLKETETHLHVAVRLEMLTHADVEQALTVADRLGRMILTLVRALEDRQ
ncbi:MAG: four helix bundle protein [Phycisphaerales bacterium]